MSFGGLRVLSLESRRAKEMEALILRYGGVPFVAPSVKERAIDDHSLAFEFVERLEAGEFDLLVCMTGVGLTFLRDVVVTRMPVERLAAALRSVTILARGSKPVPVLRQLQAPADIVVPEPNTWREIVAAVAARQERRIAVQEYGRPNPEMDAALAALGATVTPFALYRWEMPDDCGPLREAVRRLAAGEFESVIFTSSIQLDHLLAVARELNLEEAMEPALRRAVISSVGPVMTSALEARGIPPDVIPVHPKMGAQVKATAEQARLLLASKRSAG
jgi:uroporphyrinogen-III synthase